MSIITNAQETIQNNPIIIRQDYQDLLLQLLLTSKDERINLSLDFFDFQSPWLIHMVYLNRY